MYVEAAAVAGYTASRRDFRTARVNYVGDTDASAREEARQGLGQAIENGKAAAPFYMRKVVPPGGDLDDITFDYMVEQGYFWVGSPYTVYEQIRQFYDETGGFGTPFVFAGRPTASPERVLRSMELLVTE